MRDKKITIRHGKKRVSLVVGDCNLLEKFLGLMIFRKRALLLFNLRTPRRFKIHSFFCDPFVAVYTNQENEILEVRKVISWKPLILPKKPFNKLVEIPLIDKYSPITKYLLEVPLKNK